jgi:transposase
MAKSQRLYPQAESQTWKVRATAARCQSRPQRHPLDLAHGSPLGRFTGKVSTQEHMPSTLPGVDRIGRLRQNSCGIGQRPEGTRRYRRERRFHRWDLCSGEKRGDGVGTTKRGKGTKIMGLTDACGLPIAVHTASASPHEVTLVETTLDACFLAHVPDKVVGDRAYDSDPLDQRLARQRGVELIAPHRNNRVQPPTQDGRALRRHRKRWKVERLFAWLQNFRRLVVRYEYHLRNFLGMVQLGCIVILLRRVLG